MIETIRPEEHLGLVHEAFRYVRVPKRVDPVDVFGEGVVALVKGANKYNDEGYSERVKWVTFIFRRLVNAMRNYVQWRFAKKRDADYLPMRSLQDEIVRGGLTTIGDIVRDPRPLPDEIAERNEVIQNVRDTVARLPHIYYAPLLSGWDNWEIAEATGESGSVISWRKIRGLALAKQAYGVE